METLKPGNIPLPPLYQALLHFRSPHHAPPLPPPILLLMTLMKKRGCPNPNPRGYESAIAPSYQQLATEILKILTQIQGTLVNPLPLDGYLLNLLSKGARCFVVNFLKF